MPELRESADKNRNTLFPIFLKLEQLTILLIGGGNVAHEKLTALLHNCPGASVKVVATDISPAVRALIDLYRLPFECRTFQEQDLAGIDLVMIAINDKTVSAAIHSICKKNRLLTNVADTPAYCDFYLSSIVQKGSMKIAISTNGKSPTIAKRVKEVLNETFPEELEEVLNNMGKIRNTLKGDFSQKVRHLNEITRGLASPGATYKRRSEKALWFISGVAATLAFLSLLYIAFYF